MSNVRVLIAKPGLDGHDRGAKVLSRALRDEGFEVIYTGIRRSPSEIADSVLEEDVDVLGISILSGAHLELTPKIMKELNNRGLSPGEDVLVLMGGIIPDEDVEKLKEMGVSEVFGPGKPTKKISQHIRNNT
uniref:Cobalamin B12-binding domain-containing protein n=1 Tax=uncultured organism TaxID=155900 RepID=M1QB14_9ZZZZ|nr:cobalamin B12-binding domain-containing protein [uncultured organism]